MMGVPFVIIITNIAVRMGLANGISQRNFGMINYGVKCILYS